MAERVHHCPFLNRSEPRCSSHFSLNDLGSALEQCFGQYSACGVYRELLRERRQRRGELKNDSPTAWRAVDDYGLQTVQLTHSAGRH
jgi:hypothetical protein